MTQEQPERPQVQMDLADARLLEMHRAREQDAVRRVDLARKDQVIASRDVQDCRHGFHSCIKDMSEKYGKDLTFFEIDPISGKGQMADHFFRQQQMQKQMQQQPAAKMQQHTNIVSSEVPPMLPSASEEEAKEEVVDAKTEDQQGEDSQAGSEEAEEKAPAD